MKLYRALISAVAVGVAAAARNNSQVEMKFARPGLMQDLVTSDDLITITIPDTAPGISDSCYDGLLLLQSDALTVEALEILFLTQAQECIRILSDETLEEADGIILNVEPCDVNEELVAARLPCQELGGEIADITVTEDLTRTDSPDFFSRQVTDYYYCVPFGEIGDCSVFEVESIAQFIAVELAIASQELNEELQEEDGEEPVAQSEYSVTSIVFDDEGVPQGIFGNADGYVTSVSITGAGVAEGAGGYSIDFTSTDLGFADVTALVANGMSPGAFGKNAAASLNLNVQFRSSGCIADFQERALANDPLEYQLNIYCPFDAEISARENTNPGVGSLETLMSISSFTEELTGFDMSGSGAQDLSVPTVETNAPAENNVDLTLPNGETLARVVVPIATLSTDAASSASSTGPAVATVVCLALATVARRFC